MLASTAVNIRILPCLRPVDADMVQTRSITVAIPCPTPMHIVAKA